MDRSPYDEVSSPAVSLESVFISSAVLAAHEGRHVSTMDISGAFLNAEMFGERVYVRLDKRVTTFLLEFDPEGATLVNPDGIIVVQLLKTMYGCIQSSLLWYEHIIGSLKSLNFVCSPRDVCVLRIKLLCVYMSITCSSHLWTSTSLPRQDWI